MNDSSSTATGTALPDDPIRLAPDLRAMVSALMTEVDLAHLDWTAHVNTYGDRDPRTMQMSAVAVDRWNTTVAALRAMWRAMVLVPVTHWRVIDPDRWHAAETTVESQIAAFTSRIDAMFTEDELSVDDIVADVDEVTDVLVRDHRTGDPAVSDASVSPVSAMMRVLVTETYAQYREVRDARRDRGRHDPHTLATELLASNRWTLVRETLQGRWWNLEMSSVEQWRVTDPDRWDRACRVFHTHADVMVDRIGSEIRQVESTVDDIMRHIDAETRILPLALPDSDTIAAVVGETTT